MKKPDRKSPILMTVKILKTKVVVRGLFTK